MNQQESTHKYDDIITQPHHTSPNHARMSISDRAAQFSPFAALTGYDDAVRETARLTDERIILDEDERQVLDERFLFLRAHLADRPRVAFTFFKPDLKKAGGAYVSASGVVRRVDDVERQIIMEDGTVIYIDAVTAIDGDLFSDFVQYTI